MFDDDKPDYFVADESSETTETQPAPAAAGSTITFEPTQPAPDQEPKPRKKHRARNWLITVLTICVFTIGAAFYIRYCTPYATDCHITGYVTSVEKRGIIFKTYEAQVVSASAIEVKGDTEIYNREESFSVDDPAVVSALQKIQGSGIKATIEYEKYYGTLPWRGASKNIIVSIK